MTTITPFRNYTASLFGMQPKVSVQAAPVLPAQNTVSTSSRSNVASSPFAGGSGGYEAYKDPEFIRDPAAAIAKSEAAFAAWDAKEQQFEQENGFRRKVNSMALGSYAQAQSGNFAVPSFKTASEATEYLAHLVGSMTSNASVIKSSSFEAQSLAKPEVVAFYGDAKTGQLRAKYADSQKAAEMDLFVLNAVLSKAFSTSGPIYSQEGGKVSFMAQDFTFGGKSIARLSEDGFLTRLGADGQPAGVDRRI